jgi:carboxymethylenebutenolidase
MQQQEIRIEDTAVAFYGVGPEQHLDVAAQVRTPLMMHFGNRDKHVPPQARSQIALATIGRDVGLHLYPGADHGFYTRAAPRTYEHAMPHAGRTHGSKSGLAQCHMSASSG